MNTRLNLFKKSTLITGAFISGIAFSAISLAEVRTKATTTIKIPMAVEPSTRPQTIAYHPALMHYYVADGGLAPLASMTEIPISKSKVHAFDSEGKYVNTEGPGYDNRSVYYNPESGLIETITYNISSAFGFAPNTGIFGLQTEDSGEIKNTSTEIIQFNPAFGDSFTMPSYDPENKLYYAKQQRSNKVFVVDRTKREPIAKIDLDLKAAGAKYDDVSDSFVAFSGVKGEELVLLDIDHKAALVFNLKGEFVAKCALPKELKLHAKNYYNGLGYTNEMLFVYNENEGEFGTYHGINIYK